MALERARELSSLSNYLQLERRARQSRCPPKLTGRDRRRVLTLLSDLADSSFSDGGGCWRQPPLGRSDGRQSDAQLADTFANWPDTIGAGVSTLVPTFCCSFREGRARAAPPAISRATAAIMCSALSSLNRQTEQSVFFESTCGDPSVLHLRAICARLRAKLTSGNFCLRRRRRRKEIRRQIRRGLRNTYLASSTTLLARDLLITASAPIKVERALLRRRQSPISGGNAQKALASGHSELTTAR